MNKQQNLEWNFICDTDNYKIDHGEMLPNDTDNLSESIIPRKPNKYSTHVVAIGHQYYTRKYAAVTITEEMIGAAQIEAEEQGHEFNRARWMYIVRAHKGKLPLEFRAVPEGTVLPVGVPSVLIEATDKKCAWLPGYIEPAFQRVVWKMGTVATVARSLKKYLQEVMEDMEGHTDVPYHVHNFGSRSADSQESAVMAGISHAVVFDGSDEHQANRYIKWLYNTNKAYTSSVLASEHSIMTAWSDADTRNDYHAAVKMVDMLEKVVERFENTGKGIPVVSVVIDTYDAKRFARQYIGQRLKQRIINLGKRGGKLVLRPDSGDPTTMPIEILDILMDEFGYTTNSKGFKNLPPYIGVIQGDGIDQDSLRTIVDNLYKKKYSLQNLVFGMGSGLVHEAGRDEFSFAMKATARLVNDKWIDMFKDPITDQKKKSLRGRCTTFKCNLTGKIFADRLSLMDTNKNLTDMLEPIFRNGEILVEYDFDTVRENAK